MRHSGVCILIFCITFVFGLLPQSVRAAAIITEIMYSLDGADADREWVEVKNDGGNSIDLSSWTLLENDTNHGLSVVSGDGTVSAGGYAIIADDPDAFTADYPDFSGVLFDSVFSLKNGGESIALVNEDGTTVDSVTYSPDWGADGDGNSLTLDGGDWLSASPTPGTGAESSGDVSDDDVDSGGDDTGSSGSGNENDDNGDAGADNESSSQETTADEDGGSGGSDTNFLEVRDLKRVEAGGDRTVVAGDSEFYEANAYDQNGDELMSVTYTWNFGDGTVHTGKKILYTFNYPGSYVVSVIADAPREFRETDRFTVRVVSASPHIVEVSSTHIAIGNDSGRKLDISLWSLQAGHHVFQIPKNTIILPGNTLRFPHRTTGFSAEDAGRIALQYPNGRIAHRYADALASINADDERTVRASAVDEPSDVFEDEPETYTEKGTLDEQIETDREVEEATEAARSEIAAVVSLPSEYDGLLPWLLALGALLIVSIGGLLFVRAREASRDGTDPYTIIDESDTV